MIDESEMLLARIMAVAASASASADYRALFEASIAMASGGRRAADDAVCLPENHPCSRCSRRFGPDEYLFTAAARPVSSRSGWPRRCRYASRGSAQLSARSPLARQPIRHATAEAG
jgi:hypothetical protein